MTVNWIFEPNIVPELHDRWCRSAEGLGHRVFEWNDVWADSWPTFDSFTLFHGSLGVASMIKTSAPWRPGAYCDETSFECSRWFPLAEKWLLHRRWLLRTVEEFVSSPDQIFAEFGNPKSVFVRPDSPLKPFSGRLVPRDAVSLAALDHGFYYDDTSLPIIIAPAKTVEREWRYVVVNDEVVAGSAYAAMTRSAQPDSPAGEPWHFASTVAKSLMLPERVCVLDICAANDRLWLLELNPFSGADLYACNTDAVARAIERVAHCD